MLDFIYSTPTKVYFGKDKHKEVGKIIADLGYNRIMLQYGKNSIKKSGLYDEVMASLKENNVSVVEIAGVEPNPKVELARKAVEVAKEKGVQMILAVGGGSVIDSSKATALGAKNDFDVWDIMMGKVTPTDALPVGCILTHSAAGSEMSNSAVITNLKVNTKKGVGTELIRCKFAILNPELTYSVSKYQTACGIVDMMTHTLERYFTNHPEVELTDRISESIIKSIVNAGLVATKNPNDYEARATLMWGSSLAHNGLTGCGRENYLVVHQLEHAVSGLFDEVAHGAGLAVLYPAWAKYVYKYNVKRFSQLARRVWDVTEKDDEKAALLGIEKMQDFFKEIGMPTKLSEFNISKDRLDDLTNSCTKNGEISLKSYVPLGFKEVKDIFEMCF